MNMTTQRQLHLASRFGRMGALVVAAAALTACGGEAEGLEEVSEVSQAEGFGGMNNLAPFAVDSDPLKRSVTDSFGITSSTNADPLPLCKDGTITSTGCTMRPEWEAWMNADMADRTQIMKGIAKCTESSSFSFTDSTGAWSFAGQWPLYPGWKSNRLDGQAKRERISSCILTLLNGNNQTLLLCIIGPGGSPFSDPCSDSIINTREGGFFGDLFAATPTAYVAGPDTADPVDSGRACTATQGTYCCAESDASCPHRIVLAGAILGSPDQNFANKRCNAPLVDAGGYKYCPSFFSTREPGRSYTNVFTTFVPPAL
jgi:hypothetical protein